MSRGYNRHRSVFRRDAGRAFLRFLIGLVLLVALCALFYIFVLQGKIDLHLPEPAAPTDAPVAAAEATPAPETATAEPVDEQATAEPVSEQPTAEPETVQATAEPTAVPTVEPAVAPTAEPVSEPATTALPAEELTDHMDPVPENLPETTDASLKLGLKEMRVMRNDGNGILVVRGYAYIEGADAQNSKGYLLLTDAASGVMLGCYPVTPKPEDADLTFDAAAGANLDQAFFQMNLDLNTLEDGIYLISMAVENNGKIVWNYFDNSMFHFYLTQGIAVLSE